MCKKLIPHFYSLGGRKLGGKHLSHHFLVKLIFKNMKNIKSTKQNYLVVKIDVILAELELPSWFPLKPIWPKLWKIFPWRFLLFYFCPGNEGKVGSHHMLHHLFLSPSLTAWRSWSISRSMSIWICNSFYIKYTHMYPKQPKRTLQHKI